MACTHAAKLEEAGQGQVLRFWEQLDSEGREHLTAEIAEVEARIGLAKLAGLVRQAEDQAAQATQSAEITPPEEAHMGDATDAESRKRWHDVGLRLIAEGKCAAAVMAGGQGTRLGSTFPKGILGDGETPGADIGLLGKQSLFALQAHRISRLEKLAAEAHPGTTPRISFLVMTSDATHSITKSFFESRQHFGLQPEQVFFFKQGRMPCMDTEGRILLAQQGALCLAPDGNGGIYPGLQRGGALDFMSQRGVEWMQVFSVDNILVRVADPVFYGFCAERGVDAASKTVAKKDASEAVGVFACRGGDYGVIEYSEIGEERSKETAPSGALLYNAANPAIHCYSLPFLQGPALQYSSRDDVWHRALKDIPTVDGKVKGVKMEGFIFDAFAVAKTFGLLKINRQSEFSAIKNSDDKPRDTPKTAIADLSALHRQWLTAAGVDTGARRVELSPLVSYDGEGLEPLRDTYAGLVAGLGPEDPLYIEKL
eukprot:TRINITY_DN21021_c0_g1_i1.p1 TRINITY_DN21021_c0_g1~~TRINITY_DN21021_c0_g1_i1.p1  ORF type:complete len:511 (+),score=191.79 TRINITY_DN21021_c0_g1_i1:85-1533(+)